MLSESVPAKALGCRVNVFGTLHTDARGESLRVEVKQVRWLRAEDELPSTASLTGIDPEFTGALSTEEHIRSMLGS